MFATVEHDKHRMRRAALNPFFSKASVRRLQPVIQERLDVMMERFRGFGNSGEVMTVSLAFAAFTNGYNCSYPKFIREC
jgi:cytochrome P450